MGKSKRISIPALLVGLFAFILATNAFSLIAMAAARMLGTDWADTYIDDDNYWFGLALVILSMLCAGFYTGRYAYLKGRVRWNQSLILAIAIGGYSVVESFRMIGEPLADPFAMNILYDVSMIASLLYGDRLAKRERDKLNRLVESNTESNTEAMTER
ncbi:hypothetical protein [Paenibacillus methanolicus]|uniref:Uncharacterized protein n=1 Tax=Paenibacillus methanolicus TaxID=582686 RepID=A0A5S5BV57_9BACL|nr:hypothetical protein [Paenibacillus methanolicus]TYP70062.1 hypothetical protein BCM02_11240 [Paenibacillus methanolicus]